MNNELIGKGKKKLLESGSTVHLLKATKTTGMFNSMPFLFASRNR